MLKIHLIIKLSYIIGVFDISLIGKFAKIK